ncbi:chorismate mutase [Flavobacterium sp. CG_9.1]|uniref:hypothetical protein n=1 Tax=Flavobacterium sp. CG_9.1 TaxID=2787728 RepID=UPI0018CB4996|nr:hypothetical protein [Flavobacterium sp. CG_9.1]MBG6062958.1 chorismate mutase [Flavobacterium sp. CG_9.1]
MKIFLPFKKDPNPYLDEITNNSVHTYVYDNYLNYDPSYNFVHIHWPEAIFDWKEPSEEELNILERIINKWKRKSILIYTKHDYLPNKGTTINFTKLFDLIERSTDVFIHLGKYSKNLYEEKYPTARHEIIYHPLYSMSYCILDKKFARKELQIEQEKFVIIVPGNIRNYAERDMMLKAFKSLDITNKVLVCINMHAELRYDFPGRTMLKRIIDIKNIMISHFKKNHGKPHFLFTYGFQSHKDLELKMSAADLVFIPRIESLNSGMFFLGLTFNKIVVGPAVGNIKEQLKGMGLPIFNPKQNLSVSNALKKGVQLSMCHKSFPAKLMKRYMPKIVAKQMDDLINDLFMSGVRLHIKEK